jgi:hypothetical protein
VARQAAEQIELRAQGFMARWLWVVPVSLVGRRPAAPRGAPAAVGEDYHKRMTALWESEAPAKGQPNWLRFSAEADRVFQGLAGRIEPRLAEGADLADLADWCGKLTGAAARVAGTLHAATLISEGGTLAGSEVGGATAAAAVELAETYLLPHARAAFSGVMGASQRVRDAWDVLRWLRTHCANTAEGWPAPRLNKRAIFEACKGRWPTVEKLDNVLALLVAHRYLQPIPPPARPGPGRKPSQEYYVNPRGLVPDEGKEGS